jgi:hypothetical protein
LRETFALAGRRHAGGANEKNVEPGSRSIGLSCPHPRWRDRTFREDTGGRRRAFHLRANVLARARDASDGHAGPDTRTAGPSSTFASAYRRPILRAIISRFWTPWKESDGRLSSEDERRRECCATSGTDGVTEALMNPEARLTDASEFIHKVSQVLVRLRADL